MSHSFDKHFAVCSHLDSDSAVLAELHSNDRKATVVVDFNGFDFKDLAIPSDGHLASWNGDRVAVYGSDIGFAFRFQTESAKKVGGQQKAQATTGVEQRRDLS